MSKINRPNNFSRLAVLAGQSQETDVLMSDASSLDQSFSGKLFDNTNRDSPLYVTDVQLASILSISVHTIRKWRSQGKIKPNLFGRSVRYTVDEVVAVLTRKGKSSRDKQRW